ncbi:MAG: type phosphodiesterase/nucleotide pyrophosphatase [Actinobacteria bacterium]|nr:type phosphodiesterase/nucleotide pyrophosphatase [Actinomycetota bacterium]
MKHRLPRSALVGLSVMSLTSTAVAGATAIANAEPAHHVLLISVDGLHASDVTKCMAANLCPTIASLMANGTSYSNVSTSTPSDSSPGVVALTTGATPKLSGVYYDDSYDRTMFTPPAQLPTGTVQDCSGPPGAEMQYFENLDINAPSTANGGIGSRTILNESIDPAQLPRALVGGKCVPVAPNDYLRSNSMFSVAHQAGLRTAWADKHPSANVMVSGHGTANAVDDKFMTEINADIIPPSLVDTRGNTVTFPLPNPTGDNNGPFITDKVGDTSAYDEIKVDAILNQIDGLNSAGTKQVGTPAIFGMNFQSVSVGQKLVDPQLSCVRSNNAPGCDPNYFPGGYEPTTLQFTPQLSGAVSFVDGALGKMVAELKAKNKLSSTDIIVTAKHGQSPTDPSKLAKVGHTETTVVTNAGVAVAQTTDDDISLMWLKNQSQVTTAVNALLADKAGANAAKVQYVLSGKALADRFNSPLVDPRTPDLIVQPVPGTIYTGSGAKVAEHGGFATDDTHVALIVVNGARLTGGHGNGGGNVVDERVDTAQVAPTVLAALGLNPYKLDAVRIEHTQVLPGFEG